MQHRGFSFNVASTRAEAISDAQEAIDCAVKLVGPPTI
jgi:hypothetical protein